MAESSNAMASHQLHSNNMSDIRGGQRQRIEWIDLGKALGIILVSFGHLRNGDGSSVWLPALDATINGIYLFHMPLFFLLGGLTFSARGGFTAFLIRKVRTLLVPYYFFSLYFLAKPLAILVIPSLRTSFQTTHNYAIGHQFYDVLIMGNGLWFLMAFFVAEMIMYGLTKLVRSFATRMFSGIFLVIVAFTLSTLHVMTDVPFQIMMGIRISGFMLIGLALREWFIYLSRKAALIIMIVAIVIVISSQTLLSLRIVENSSVLLYTIITIVAALSGAFGFTCMAIVIKHNAWLAYIGRNSLVYYALNALTLNIVKVTLFRVLHINALFMPYIAQLCIGLVGTVFAILLLTVENVIVQRWMWWSIGKQRP